MALDKDELQLDGILPEDESTDQQVCVQRVGEGAWLVRPLVDGELPDLDPWLDESGP